MIDVNKAISTAVRTGKVSFGAKNAIETARIGKARLIVVSANCPKDVRESIDYYSKISEIPVVQYKGTGVDMGAACGKPFIVSVITVREPGDSEILKLTEATNV
jgi:large subunit ribosomal protein L30e